LLSVVVVVADSGFAIIVLWKKRDLERRKVLQWSFFFPGPRDTKPWVRKLRILSPKKHRNFSTFRQHVLPPPTSHLALFTHPLMTIPAQAAEMQ